VPCALLTLFIAVFPMHNFSENPEEATASTTKIVTTQHARDNTKEMSQFFPLVAYPIKTSLYEHILMTQLRDRKTDTALFRAATQKLGGLLVNKVVELLPVKTKSVQTPVSAFHGKELMDGIELLSVMHSGNALLESFMHHFPKAPVSKILIQRDEKTAKPVLKHMKITPNIAHGKTVIITEPMIATGGTLGMVISLLKAQGVSEKNIIIASLCVAPEGLLFLSQHFSKIRVTMTVLDEKLNSKKYIIPGLGDFGDRYYANS
jgi:uracil phosphoribosyltransferase